MIDISKLEDLAPITRLVIHTINLDVIEHRLEQDQDNDALRKQDLMENSRQATQELQRARKRIIGRIERFDEKRVDEINQVRQIIADVGPDKAVSEIKSVINQSANGCREIVNTIVEWEREAGLRGPQRRA